MNQNQKVVLLLGAGLAAYWYYTQQSGAACPTVCGNCCPPSSGNCPGPITQIQAAVMGWQSVGSGATWVPVLNSVEQQFNFPDNLLAATAYQESSFNEGVIRGTTPSSDGLSLGIMQLRTSFYASVQAAVPFSDADVEQQIQDAANTFQTNYAALGSWPLAIAAFNQGLTGVQKNGITSVTYVNNILGNAPNANA